MRLFHRAQPVRDRTLYLPYAMRAALGWHQKRTLYCWSRDMSAGPGNQISISAIMPNEREVWHLSVRFRDRRGLLAELSKLLTDESVNIISCQSSSHVQNREFIVEMTVDTKTYHPRRSRPDPLLHDLHIKIACRFIKDLVFEDDAPSLHITPNPVLNVQRDAILLAEPVLEGRHLHLPATAMDAVETIFSRQHGAPMKGRTPLALLVADLDAAILETSIYYTHAGYMHIGVKARDCVGTLKAITTTLFNHGFSILQAYHRTIEIGRASKTDLLVRKPLAPGQVQMDNHLLSELQYIFSGEELQREFGFKVTQQRLAEPPGATRDE